MNVAILGALLSALDGPPEPWQVDDRRLHLDLSGDAVFGVGGQMFLGTVLQLDAKLPIWRTRRATGSFDFGGQLHYANEPVFLAPWLRGQDVTGASHRVQLTALVGHAFHLGRRRRFELGTGLSLGWSQWISSYAVRYPDEGVTGEETVSRAHFVASGQLELGYRFAERWGVHGIIAAPFPTAPDPAIGLAFVGVGLTFHLR